MSLSLLVRTVVIVPHRFLVTVAVAEPGTLPPKAVNMKQHKGKAEGAAPGVRAGTGGDACATFRSGTAVGSRDGREGAKAGAS